MVSGEANATNFGMKHLSENQDYKSFLCVAKYLCAGADTGYFKEVG